MPLPWRCLRPFAEGEHTPLAYTTKRRSGHGAGPRVSRVAHPAAPLSWRPSDPRYPSLLWDSWHFQAGSGGRDLGGGTGSSVGGSEPQRSRVQDVGERSTVKPLCILYGGARRRPEGASSMGLCLALPAHGAGPLPDSSAPHPRISHAPQCQVLARVFFPFGFGWNTRNRQPALHHP